MAIISTPITQTPPTLTTEQKQVRLKARVIARNDRLLALMVLTFNDNYADFNANADGLSLQDAINSFAGADQSEIFRVAAIVKSLANSVKANAITSPDPNVTVNGDGTVTANG